MVTQLGPKDLRVSKHHSTCLTTGIIVTHPFKEQNLRKLEKMARQAASASPHSMLPSLRENRRHRRHQTRLSESEGNFSIIRNTFDRELRGGGGGGGGG